jgi:hypothetical protein
MMTRRKRFTLIILLLLALLLLLVWLWWVVSDRPVLTSEEVVVEEVEKIIPTRPTISELELEQEREIRTTSADVISLSKSFVTRYGSYSNEAHFANLEDVLPLVSASFSAQLQTMIDTGIAPETYYGVTTSIVSVKVTQEDEAAGTASATITTQREEAIGSPQHTSVKYQDIVLTFVMEDGSWKVNYATWQ